MKNLKNSTDVKKWQFNWIQTATGEETISVITPEGKSFLLHSVINPYKEARSLVETIDTSKNSLYFVFGTGMGYHLKILKEKITPSSRVVVIEPYQNFLNQLKEKGVIEKIADNRFIFMAGNLNNLVPQIDKLFYGEHFMLASNCRFLILPAYNRVFKDWVIGLQKQIINLIKNRLFEMGNDVADTLQGIRQTMNNLGELVSSPGVTELEGAYKGKPAIIVSAGPSLNKNVELLHEVKGKALILCVDAALNVLLQKGIVPDAVLTIERGVETYNRFYKGKILPQEPVLIGPPVIYPKIFEEYPGERVVLLRGNEGISMWLNKVLQKGMVKMGTSVAHLAFGFARLVKADPIIFIGQDLAYSPEGFSHGEGVPVNKKQDLSKVDVWVEGYNGEKLPSTRVWKNFLTWFETVIPETTAFCIDATEGGARIKGTEIMTLRDAIDTYCSGKDEITPLNVLIRNKRVSTSKGLDTILAAFRDLIEHFKDLAENAETGLWRLEKIQKKADFNKADKRKLVKILNRMRKNEKIVKMVVKNKVSVMCFQTMIFLANKQLNDLGDKLTPKNVQKNILIQQWFLERIWKVSEKIVNELEDILNQTKNKLQID